ncbi:hypothetical protein M1771_03530 [Spiroplasma citri]|uniref:Plectrovirus-related protein n=1 Tax=Spiroplasma citri TaxID=2133 RepID=A0AAX3T0S7_SPICI|nr:hypothetical protein [Spiroplasma citri]WFG97088.1 hypothetical protein M0C40_03535 [Spiroplasma citri]WFG99033.1 hypothetical protein M1770_03480 [Spiroplasma citri]WFH00987.1 hypothetical protein M1771_03530 [Spiroplasma citri]
MLENEINYKNAWLTFIGVNWNKCKNKKYKCYWKDNSIDILTLSELYFNFSNTSELNNLLIIKEIEEEK